MPSKPKPVLTEQTDFLISATESFDILASPTIVHKIPAAIINSSPGYRTKFFAKKL